MVNYLATQTPGAGAEVDQVIGSRYGVFVVLYDDEGVALVAEGHQGFEEGGIIAWVEADGWFVEDV